MVDAQLGIVGIWLAFVACLVGAVVTALGLAPADASPALRCGPETAGSSRP